MNKIKKEAVWEKVAGKNNEILQSDTFYVSYNPNTGASHMGLSDLGNMIGAAFLGEDQKLTDGEETALCYEGRFDILTGDFRKQYARALPEGLEACKEVFKKHEAKHKNNWTT